ncbi:hypothetical protein [Flavobacterium nitratireducens]|nr:hypothetical protein [Flavobacterium nitratireducens]
MIGKKIWIIDDDPIYQIIMKKVVIKSNLFTIIQSYNNGKEAIESLKKYK